MNIQRKRNQNAVNEETEEKERKQSNVENKKKNNVIKTDNNQRDLQLSPPNVCTAEESRHARIYLVITGILTEIMQELMEVSGIPPANVWTSINNDRDFLKKLTREECEQVKTLKDASKRYKKLDISLMYKIIRVFKLFNIQTPTRGWGNKPQEIDLSIGDDVERIRTARNDYLHKVISEASEKRLNEFFDVFINVGKRVDSHFQIDVQTKSLQSNDSFERRIQNFKTCYLDERSINKALESSRVVESREAWYTIQDEKDINTIHVYKGKGLTEYINERKKLPVTEKTPLILIFENISDGDAEEVAEFLNNHKEEINAGLIKTQFKGAFVKCVILNLEIENEILHHDLTFEQELKLFITSVMKYVKLDSTRMVYMIVTTTEGWHITFDDTEPRSSKEYSEGNSLVLNIDVDNSILQTSDVFQQNMQQFFEVISTKTNGKRLTESNDGVAVISPIQKVGQLQKRTEVIDEDYTPQEEPHIKKEIEEFSKLKVSSGIGNIKSKELEETKVHPMRPLDPCEASVLAWTNPESTHNTECQLLGVALGQSQKRAEVIDENYEMQEDPRIEREREEFSQFKFSSRIVNINSKELEERKAQTMRHLDPFESSVVPCTDLEIAFGQSQRSLGVVEDDAKLIDCLFDAE